MFLGCVSLSIGISSFVFAEYFRRKDDTNIHTIKLYVSSVLAICIGLVLIVSELV